MRIPKELYDKIMDDSATSVIYDNTTSGLSATDVQDAIDELSLSTTKEIIEVTYNELSLLINNNELKGGQYYKITDHRTKHLIPNTSEIHSGNLEPLICLATSINTIDKIVYSELYPRDIIYYEVNDDSCEDGVWNTVLQRYEGGTIRNGRIYYRKDTINELETHYDWRNVKFRRWAVDAQLWVSGTSYNQRDVIKSIDNGNIYVAKFNTSGSIDPSNDADWQLWLDITSKTNFWSWTNNINEFNIGNITPTNLIINNTTPGVDYKDFYTFTVYDELNNSSGIIDGSGAGIVGGGYKQFILGNINYDYINYNNYVFINYNNIVFYLTPDSESEFYCNSNSFGINSFNNTIIGNYFNFNTIGNYFNFNTIGTNFYFNTIGNYFNYNTIGNEFYSNTIGNYFNFNTIGNEFYYNTIGNNFYSNTIGNYFNFNTIGNYFNFNTIGNYFNFNTIGDEFYSNTIGNIFRYNKTSNKSVDNIDFSLSTHVYGNYDCEIFKNSAGVSKLRYYDASNALQIVDITD